MLRVFSLRVRGFGEVPFLIFVVPDSFCSLPTCGNGIRCCSVTSCGGVWNGFLLGKSKEEDVLCKFCGGIDGDGHILWDCASPSFVRIKEHPEFISLMRRDRSTWPRCLAWHGWPTLFPRRVQPPWAVAEVDSVHVAMESALGVYPFHLHEAWRPGWDPEDISDLAEDVPLIPMFGLMAAGMRTLMLWLGLLGLFAFVKTVRWVSDDRFWGHAQDLEIGDDAARIFSMIPGSLQTVQRAEYWGAILALQAFMPIHLGIDNKNVCNNIGKVLSGWSGTPFSLCIDGDLLCCIPNMVL